MGGVNRAGERAVDSTGQYLVSAFEVVDRTHKRAVETSGDGPPASQRVLWIAGRELGGAKRKITLGRIEAMQRSPSELVDVAIAARLCPGEGPPRGDAKLRTTYGESLASACDASTCDAVEVGRCRFGS